MTDWRDHLTEEEAAERRANQAEIARLQKANRRIFDRARKRAERTD